MQGLDLLHALQQAKTTKFQASLNHILVFDHTNLQAHEFKLISRCTGISEAMRNVHTSTRECWF